MMPQRSQTSENPVGNAVCHEGGKAISDQFAEKFGTGYPQNNKDSEEDQGSEVAWRHHGEHEGEAQHEEEYAHRSTLHRPESAKPLAAPRFELVGMFEQFAALAAKLNDIGKAIMLGYEIESHIADPVRGRIMLLHKRKMRKGRLLGIGGAPQKRSENLAKLEMESELFNFFCKNGPIHNLGSQFKRIYEPISGMISKDLAARFFESLEVGLVLSTSHASSPLGSKRYQAYRDKDGSYITWKREGSMSSGFGRVQRIILGELISGPHQTIPTLARKVYEIHRDNEPTKSQLNSVARALTALAARNSAHKSGRIDVFGYHCWVASSHYKPVTDRAINAKLRAQKPRLVGI